MNRLFRSLTARSTVVTGRAVVVVALLLTAGVLGWWSLMPPTVLGAAGRTDMPLLLLTALFTLPLALLAAGGAAWLARHRRWRDGTPGGVARSVGATAGLFAALLLVAAPAQAVAQQRLAPAVPEPNLAAIQYDTSCPSIAMTEECQRMEAELGGLDAATVASHHRAMLRHTGHSREAYAAMTDDFYPATPGPGPEAAAYAIQDAAVVFLLAVPLALLGSAAAGRLPAAATAAAGRRRGLLRLRSRWLAVGGTLVVMVTGSVALVSSAASAQSSPFQQQLYIPPVLEGSEFTLEMVETDVQLLPTGPPTTMWTFNGNFPGPTIRRPAGEPTQLTVRNLLPQTFGEATLHHHGGHSASSEDGQADSFLIPSGGIRTYTYEHMERGEPERAAMQWYHDHRMDLTGRNVWNGLVGLFILDDEVEAALNLPSGEFDVPLVLADRTFDEHNQIPYVFNPLGTVGDTILVNGRPQPHFDVGDRKYRLRLLNASNRLPYAVELSNGGPMHQIATESGLLPEPVERHQIVLGPGERVEVVIDFAGHLGEEIVLRAIGGGGGGVAVGGDVLQFRVNRDLVDDSALPSDLRPIPEFGEVSVTREFSLDFTDDMWTINGLPFDPERFDAEPVLGSTERWIFTNNTDMSHTVHIHDVDWLLEHRGGQPPEPWENALKETWLVTPGETISLITTFTGHTGPYVFHCHMLEHEDMMMMGQFNVVPAS